MHDIKWIRENPSAFDAALQRRALNSNDRERFSSTNLLEIDQRHRMAIAHLERAQARRKAASDEIYKAMKAGDKLHADDLKTEVSQLKESISELEKTPRELESILGRLLAEIPNLPLDEVPEGADEHGNVERHHFGAKRNYAFTPKQHFELGEALGQMDFETAAKLSGARFVVLRKGLARMERALGQFMLDVHTDEHGYTEVNPPLLVRDEAMFGTAQLPKFEDDQFFVPIIAELDQSTVAELDGYRQELADRTLRRDQAQQKLSEGVIGPEERNLKAEIIALKIQSRRIQGQIQKLLGPERLGLIPTAEVSLTNLVRESILDEAELPLRFTACTPCFRAEAGAAGKDTRGMIRQHQFTKVELVSITTPEQSKDEHERMLSCAEEILRRLGLHYRVVTLCTGDMGFASQKTYDIEVWLPGQGAYREISSCSVCGDFQARRMGKRPNEGARYRPKGGGFGTGGFGKGPFGGGLRHVHTLNGSGVAVGRALVAVMETYQQEDGSIAVPDVLQPYMGGMKVIGRT